MKMLMNELQKDGTGYVVDLVQEKEEASPHPVPSEVVRVLELSAEVFQELAELPPSRKQDYTIHLKEGVSILNLRPYKYSHYQKNEIEKLVNNMLKAGIIRPSISPFFSHIILVKKKRWWMEVLCGLQGPQQNNNS